MTKESKVVDELRVAEESKAIEIIGSTVVGKLVVDKGSRADEGPRLLVG